MTSTRQRLITEAAALFGARGVRGTSVAQVQAAAGLTPGSGALYKHFRSKAELLEAVIDDYAASLATQSAATLGEVPDDPREALARIAAAVTASMTRDASILRVLLRDLDDRPDLVQRSLGAVSAEIYGAFEAWIRRAAAAGTVVAPDPAATATVLMAALTLPPLTSALTGGSPANRVASFTDAWVDVSLAALGVA